jgi:hypothetical protein
MPSRSPFLLALLARALVLVASLLLALLAGEGVMHLLYQPIDFLKPAFVPDDVLPYRIAPFSAGHDAWGFRNPVRPEHADIVAIGDSMTYGDAAPAAGSWPRWLARATGTTVYNLGLGGYGPADYLYLLETRARDLHPKLVIVGLYLGNDLYDAVARVYERDHWRELRTMPSGGEPSISTTPAAAPALPPAQPYTWEYTRGWAEQHSMLFRLIQDGPVGQTINRFADRARAERAQACSIESDPPFPTLFTPYDRLQGLDLSSPKIQEGLEITLELFVRMRRLTGEAGVGLLILILPTKESVFAGRVNAAVDPACAAVLQKIVSNEQAARNRIVAALERNGISYVDVLPALKAGVEAGAERMFLRSGDSHPNEAGYRAIATAILPYVTR